MSAGNPAWKTIIWKQFGAAIDMLDNAMLACPDWLWDDRSQQPEFWYLAYHTLFWLDLYLSGSVDGFLPPPPFALEELDPAGVIPERPCTKDELRAYLEHCRRKCRETIAVMADHAAGRRCAFRWGEVSFTELLLYNMRHVQHGAAQLNLILRRAIDSAPRWVARSAQELEGTQGDKNP
jgi:hypothetical protein